ncbi:AbrB/MazE/SpoVT family DNA-binding domain-containing protein, partial [Patescibacteria group bacterium]
MNAITKIQSRGTVTIPKKIRNVFGLNSGDLINISSKDHKIVIEPVKIDKSL